MAAHRHKLLACAELAAFRHDWAVADELLTPLPAGRAPVAALLLAARVRLQSGHYRQARELALDAGRARPRGPELQLGCLRWLRRFEEPEAMAGVVEHNDWVDWHAPDALAEATLLLTSGGLYGPAEQALDRLSRVAPRNADAHYLRGLIAMFEGRTASSLAELDAALAIDPRLPNAHWLVAMQAGPETAAGHVDRMLRVLPQVRPGTEAQVYLFYALHSRLHALGRYDEAWSALQRGMEAMRRLTPYNRDAQARRFASLKQLELPRPSDASGETHGTGQGLIFIVGMFRSGTTLIERVLTRHPAVMDGGETYQFSAAMRQATDHDGTDVIDQAIIERARGADFDMVRRRMRDYTEWRSGGRAYLTEKLPSNFLNVGLILHALPDARILHLRRDPVDTCFSNMRTILHGAAYACDQADLADFHVRYQDLMAHWHSLAPGRILDVDYGAFVGDPERHARAIFEHCGLEFVPGVLDVAATGGRAATASAAQVRQGILKNRGEAWKPYESRLRPLLSGLASGS